MNAFTIKDLENLSGIKAHTIRVWEQRYSLFKPQRTQTNIRYYSNEDLKTVLNIALLNKYGYKISHIDKMNAIAVKEKILSLPQSEAQRERIVNNLINLLVDLKIAEFEIVLDNYIAGRGIEKTITQIIFPFLERIGILWATNHINPAQEHLVTNVIRQKLIVGIDSIRCSIKTNKTILLFLPEGEHHELGLLFINYLCKNKGINTLYIGANIPLNDVEYVVKLKQPHFIFTHLTSVVSKFSLEKFFEKLSLKAKDYPIFVSGKFTHNYRKELPKNICFKKSFQEVVSFIDSI